MPRVGMDSSDLESSSANTRYRLPSSTARCDPSDFPIPFQDEAESPVSPTVAITNSPKPPRNTNDGKKSSKRPTFKQALEELRALLKEHFDLRSEIKVIPEQL